MAKYGTLRTVSPRNAHCTQLTTISRGATSGTTARYSDAWWTDNRRSRAHRPHTLVRVRVARLHERRAALGTPLTCGSSSTTCCRGTSPKPHENGRPTVPRFSRLSPRSSRVVAYTSLCAGHVDAASRAPAAAHLDEPAGRRRRSAVLKPMSGERSEAAGLATFVGVQSQAEHPCGLLEHSRSRVTRSAACAGGAGPRRNAARFTMMLWELLEAVSP